MFANENNEQLKGTKYLLFLLYETAQINGHLPQKIVLFVPVHLPIATDPRSPLVQLMVRGGERQMRNKKKTKDKIDNNGIIF